MNLAMEENHGLSQVHDQQNGESRVTIIDRIDDDNVLWPARNSHGFFHSYRDTLSKYDY